jgi:hypothetical protein
MSWLRSRWEIQVERAVLSPNASISTPTLSSVTACLNAPSQTSERQAPNVGVPTQIPVADAAAIDDQAVIE